MVEAMSEQGEPAGGTDPLTWVWAKSEQTGEEAENKNKKPTRRSAKPPTFHLLWRHLLDVAAVAAELIPIFGGVEGLSEKTLAFVVGAHDVGKADPLFQSKDAACAQPLRALGLITDDEFKKATGFRHEARTALWGQDWLMERGWDEAARVVAPAWAGHHGDFHSWLRSGYNEEEFKKRRANWDPLRQRLMEILARATGAEVVAPEEFAHADLAGMRLSALIVLADWIASSTETYPYHQLNARFPKDVNPEATCEEYYRAARTVARESVARLGFAARSLPARAADAAPAPAFTEIWPEIPTPRGAQIALEALCQGEGIPPGLVVLEAPMGEGKTEAAVYLAEYWAVTHGRDPGLYFALPTQATSNSLHVRYSAFVAARTRAAGESDGEGEDGSPASGLAPPVPRLVHGMAWLRDDLIPRHTPRTYGEEGDENADIAHHWFENARRALLAPEAVGTVDQALMAALNVKFGPLRFLGLARKTLVIDEIHSYDIYMSTIMERLLAWCRVLGTPVILLSATLTAAQKRRLVAAYTGSKSGVSETGGADPEHVAYPLLTLAAGASVRQISAGKSADRKVSLKLHHGILHDPARIAALAREAVADGGCACVLMNTVAMAQAVYRELQNLEAADPNRKADTDPDALQLRLFHARFRAGRRGEIEKEIRSAFGKGPGGKPENPNRPRRAILVATQVVEQSLDVDFDVFFSALAPMDLLLQRSGRLHRHDRPNRPTGNTPVFHILLPETSETPDFGTTGIVYAKEPLLRTLAQLTEVAGQDIWNLPGDFRKLIERAYATGTEPLPGIAPQVLSDAIAERIAREAAEAGEAGKNLIPEPNPRTFFYAQQPVAKKEAEEGQPQNEGHATSYVYARTRLGDETVPCVVLTTRREITLFRHYAEKSASDPDWRPSKAYLKRLFLQKVSLPWRWLHRVTTAEGHNPPLTDPPRWLRWHAVLFLPDGLWRGTDKDGHPFALRDDQNLGVYREKEEAPVPHREEAREDGTV